MLSINLVEIVCWQANLSWPLDENLLAVFARKRIAILVRNIATHLARNVVTHNL